MRCGDAHMPSVTVRVAAELTGRDRSTINRAIESGKLSATKSELGRYLIDPAELERVYGTLRPAPLRSDEMQEHAPTDGVASQRELDLVREMLEREREERERERHGYERDRRVWEEERTFLRSLADRHTEHIKLLTDQRERADAQRSWLARVLGRRSPTPPAA